MSPTTLPLVALTLLLVATRSLEERWWKAGRISDRFAAWLIVGRLVVLGVGFGLIVGLELPQLLLVAAGATIAAVVLEPVAERRIVAARERGVSPPA